MLTEYYVLLSTKIIQIFIWSNPDIAPVHVRLNLLCCIDGGGALRYSTTDYLCSQTFVGTNNGRWSIDPLQFGSGFAVL
jgi:hypothetical protein